jgi:hypothetical protein
MGLETSSSSYLGKGVGAGIVIVTIGGQEYNQRLYIYIRSKIYWTSFGAHSADGLVGWLSAHIDHRNLQRKH